MFWIFPKSGITTATKRQSWGILFSSLPLFFFLKEEELVVNLLLQNFGRWHWLKKEIRMFLLTQATEERDPEINLEQLFNSSSPEVLDSSYK